MNSQPWIYDGVYGAANYKHQQLLKEAEMRRRMNQFGSRIQKNEKRILLHLGVRLIKAGRFLVSQYQHSIQH